MHLLLIALFINLFTNIYGNHSFGFGYNLYNQKSSHDFCESKEAPNKIIKGNIIEKKKNYDLNVIFASHNYQDKFYFSHGFILGLPLGNNYKKFNYEDPYSTFSNFYKFQFKQEYSCGGFVKIGYQINPSFIIYKKLFVNFTRYKIDCSLSTIYKNRSINGSYMEYSYKGFFMTRGIGLGIMYKLNEKHSLSLDYGIENGNKFKKGGFSNSKFKLSNHHVVSVSFNYHL